MMKENRTNKKPRISRNASMKSTKDENIKKKNQV